ncbi:MAG: IMP cyclohydrolase [Clostridia bacterium]|nr:IMP cyclohydrolase [Clostridia bacterium]
MNVYAIDTISQVIGGNSYPGRGVLLGKSADGKNAVVAYFIMGRSANSRNRIFVENGEEVIIHPFDASKVEDPSLIIYSPIRKVQNHLVVTNGDQTDTIVEGIEKGLSFSDALKSREFEPDAPNFTPRISGMLTFAEGDVSYQMSILKSADAEGTACNRFTYDYAATAGLGHLIHTYVCDGNPIPTFQGEPERVAIPNEIDAFTTEIWNALDEQNRISLYVRYIDLETGTIQNRMINQNK